MNKLVEARFIKPYPYSELLTNEVMVSKACGNWQMWIDYTNLNDAYPKNFFSLPRINQMVYAITRHAYLSFMDANLGYHQVMISKQDKHKIAFVNSWVVYNYKVIPFSLKNVGVPFQRLMDEVFEEQRVRL